MWQGLFRIMILFFIKKLWINHGLVFLLKNLQWTAFIFKNIKSFRHLINQTLEINLCQTIISLRSKPCKKTAAKCNLQSLAVTAMCDIKVIKKYVRFCKVLKSATSIIKCGSTTCIKYLRFSSVFFFTDRGTIFGTRLLLK